MVSALVLVSLTITGDKMNLSDSHKRILNFLESEGPHTADETQEKLGHDFHQTNSALFSKMLIVDVLVKLG